MIMVWTPQPPVAIQVGGSWTIASSLQMLGWLVRHPQ